MLNFPDFYQIEVEINERDSAKREPFLTFEEAMENRMKFANWWRPNGDVWILKISGKDLSCLETWHVNEKGEITSHYKY